MVVPSSQLSAMFYTATCCCEGLHPFRVDVGQRQLKQSHLIVKHPSEAPNVAFLGG